ncbi:MAG: Ig-like domain-containing protein, partial [Candidatus Marinimicrobia bacterium]|nr:Ig-like domain-containing protein [Candidatus Neomarinimicrobiota bacterium]
MKLFNSKTIILFFFVAYCTCNIYSCAAIQAPPGGPKDNTPPTLLFSIPSSGATNLSLKKVELVFSEHLLEKSVISSISILPKTFSPISVQYKGKKLIISLPDDLLDNQTY